MSEEPLPTPDASDADFTRALTRMQRVPCPVCGAGVPPLDDELVCPECTAPLNVGIGSPDLRLRAWIASVLGLALPLGFSLVGVIAFIGGTLSGARFGRGTGPVFGVFLGGFAVLVTALVLVVVRRRRFWRASRERQWIFAGWLIGLGALVIVGLWAALILRHSL